MRDVLFVRTPMDAGKDITVILKNLARAGWQVVSHTVDSWNGEYSFVLQGDEGSLRP